jgi:hypothetical protein
MGGDAGWCDPFTGSILTLILFIMAIKLIDGQTLFERDVDAEI